MPGAISDDDYNAHGTFYFPAGFRNVTQYIAFWDNVVIPDSALETLLSDQEGLSRILKRKGLESLRASARNQREHLRHMEEEDGSDLMRKVMARHVPEIRATLSETEAQIRKSEEELATHRSGDPDEFLTPVLARPVARATGLVRYLPAELDAPIRDRVLDHKFELGDGRWMSARSLVDRFKTLDLDFLYLS